jgi:putative MATE family efflux protein
MTQREGVMSVVWEALRGGDRDFTSMGLRRAIVLLSIPMVLEMAMESLFALVDVFFVSRLGVEAVAVVGLTEGVMMLVYSLAWGLAAGITAVVARRTGEQDREGADVAAFQGILVMLGFGLLFALPGLFFPRELLRLIGAGPEVAALGTPFLRIMLGSNVVILLLFGINAIFRGAGDAALAMRSLWLANIVNMVLDPLLIFGWGPVPAMGVTGAAVATVCGRGCGVLYQCWHLFNGQDRVRIALRHMRPAWAVLRNILRVSAGAAGQFLIASASWVFLVRIVAGFGSDAVAGYTIAVRIIIFALLPAWGVANAASTLVGQNLGARQPERAERSAWLCGHYNLAYMATMAVLFFVAAPLGHRLLHGRPPCAPHRGGGPAHRGPGLFLLRLWHGAGPGVQRGRRCHDARLAEPGLLLAPGDPLGMGPRPLAGCTRRRVHRHCRERKRAGPVVHVFLPQGKVEDRRGLIALTPLSPAGPRRTSATSGPSSLPSSGCPPRCPGRPSGRPHRSNKPRWAPVRTR